MNESVARHLNLMRRIGVGSGAELVLLTHGSVKGYAQLSVPVEGGWTLEDGELDQVQTLVIVERSWVTKELLLQVKAVAVNGAVYELIGNGVRAASQAAAVKEWKFPVAPTGEVWP